MTNLHVAHSAARAYRIVVMWRRVGRPIDLLCGAPVPVHRMAEQEFCELKADFELRCPEIETQFRTRPELTALVESVDAGKDFHETMASPAQSIAPAELEELIAMREAFTLVESPLRGRYGQLPFEGRPDALHFDGHGNAWVIEHKVRDKRRVYETDDAQLRMYGFLLRRDQRFKATRISLVCVITNRPTAADLAKAADDLRAEVIRAVCTEPPVEATYCKRWDSHVLATARNSRLWSAIFNYDDAKARSELKFFKDYWFGTRLPIPTKKQFKCASCRVNALNMCPVARAKYGERIRRRRKPRPWAVPPFRE